MSCVGGGNAHQVQSSATPLALCTEWCTVVFGLFGRGACLVVQCAAFTSLHTERLVLRLVLSCPQRAPSLGAGVRMHGAGSCKPYSDSTTGCSCCVVGDVAGGIGMRSGACMAVQVG